MTTVTTAAPAPAPAPQVPENTFRLIRLFFEESQGMAEYDAHCLAQQIRERVRGLGVEEAAALGRNVVDMLLRAG